MLALQSIAKNLLPVLCVACALVWLPLSNVRPSSPGRDHGAFHVGAAWRGGALQGQRSADLREFFRSAERWPAGFVSRRRLHVSGLLTAAGGVDGSPVERWHVHATRRSLAGHRESGLKDDGPAQVSHLL